MQDTKLPLVLDTIRRLVRRNATANLRKILDKTHPADVANLFRYLNEKEIRTVFSLLDERQRRLYAGLESQKFGHGGDRKIADLLGLDVHTVARGRRELFSGDVDPERVRRQGGGRKAVEKKRRTSSRSSGS